MNLQDVKKWVVEHATIEEVVELIRYCQSEPNSFTGHPEGDYPDKNQPEKPSEKKKDEALHSSPDHPKKG